MRQSIRACRTLVGVERGAAVRGRGLGRAGVALAHHSFAMFDSDHQVKLAGTVKSFEWSNPHVYIELNATGADGSSQGLHGRMRQSGHPQSHRLEVQHDQAGRQDHRDHRAAEDRRAGRVAEAGDVARWAQVRQRRPGGQGEHQ